MKLYIIFLILLLFLIYNLTVKENFLTNEELKKMTPEDLEELNRKILFNEKIRLLREESIRAIGKAKSEQSYDYLNEDKIKTYLTEYKCSDYEDIRI